MQICDFKNCHFANIDVNKFILTYDGKTVNFFWGNYCITIEKTTDKNFVFFMLRLNRAIHHWSLCGTTTPSDKPKSAVMICVLELQYFTSTWWKMLANMCSVRRSLTRMAPLLRWTTRGCSSWFIICNDGYGIYQREDKGLLNYTLALVPV